MEKIGKIFRFLGMINFRSVYFNLKYFPLRTAIRLPVLVSSNVLLKCTEGQIRIEGPIFTGVVRLGYGDMALFDRRRSKGIWEVKGLVVFKGKAWIGQGTKISVGQTGRIIFGPDFEVTANSAIVSYSEIEFGKKCLLSWDVLIMDTDFHAILNAEGAVINAPKCIKIDDNVWIGCRSTILKGSHVGPGNVIAAGTVVTKKLEGEQTIYGGPEAKILRENITWKQ